MTESTTLPDRANEDVKGSGYELFILLLSILSIVNLVIVAFPPIGPIPDFGPIRQVAFVVDLMLTVAFLGDFLFRLLTSLDRRRYFVHNYGWADLLATPPALRIFRLFRVIRVGKRLRQRGADAILAELDRNRASTTFFVTLFLVILVVEFAGMAVYLIEHDAPGANIVTPSDALWWGFVTITTVGYGDQYPITDAGRIVGTALLFAGIALFSVLTGFIANAFLAPRSRRKTPGLVEGTVEADLAHLRDLLDKQEAHVAAIRSKLDDLEHKTKRAAADKAGSAEVRGAAPVGLAVSEPSRRARRHLSMHPSATSPLRASHRVRPGAARRRVRIRPLPGGHRWRRPDHDPDLGHERGSGDGHGPWPQPAVRRHRTTQPRPHRPGSWWDAEAVDGGWRVTVEVGWGDCPAGCIDRHTWTWDVAADGRTAFGGETGTPLADQVLAGLQDASRAQGLGGWAIAGPACPVERPGDPACAARMVEGAALTVRNAAGVEVASFTTDGSGLFRIPLAPGEYGVDAAPVEGLMGTPGPATVTVDEGNEAWLDVAYDTGIR